MRIPVTQWAVLFSLLLAQTGAATFPTTYSFGDGSTNVYRVTIEAISEGQPETNTGLITIAARVSPDGNITLIFSGKIEPSGGMMIRPAMENSRFDPALPLIDYSRIPARLVIDPSGNPLEISGDIALPVPLGSMFQTFLEPFPDRRKSSWKRTEITSILDEPALKGPAGFPGGVSVSSGYPVYSSSSPYLQSRNRGRPVSVSSTLESATTVASAPAGHVILLKRTQQVASRLRHQSAPKIVGTNVTTFHLDPATRVPRRIVSAGASAYQSETRLRHMRSSLLWEQLEGTALQAALAPPPPTPVKADPNPLTDNDVRLKELPAQLKTADHPLRNEIFSLLVRSKLDTLPQALVAAIAEASRSSDYRGRELAFELLAKYATQAEVDLLVAELKASEPAVRSHAVTALCRLRNPRITRQLVTMVAEQAAPVSPFPRSSSSHGPILSEAAQVLCGYDAQAEDEVLSLFQERNLQTRAQACKILEHIGTTQSLKLLTEMVGLPDQTVSEAAAAAIRSIKTRSTAP